jgi:hypothetical protein
MEFTSHIEGRNAKVAIYEDRIEWGRSGWRPAGGATAAVLTGGASLLLPGKRRDTNMIPIRQIQGVTTHRAGLRFAVVKVGHRCRHGGVPRQQGTGRPGQGHHHQADVRPAWTP